MKTEIVTFRLDAAKKKAMDIIAAGINRDRSFILNEAIQAYTAYVSRHFFAGATHRLAPTKKTGFPAETPSSKRE